MHSDGLGGIWGDIWGGIKKGAGWVWDNVSGSWQPESGLPQPGTLPGTLPYPGTPGYVPPPPPPPSGTPTGTTFDPNTNRYYPPAPGAALGNNTGLVLAVGLGALLLLSRKRR